MSKTYSWNGEELREYIDDGEPRVEAIYETRKSTLKESFIKLADSLEPGDILQIKVIRNEL